MASTHTYKVAMHCTDKEPIEVNNLATAVSAGLTANSATFAPTSTLLTTLNTNLAALNTANGKLSNYIANAPGNHNTTTLRNSQTVIVYNMLNTTFRTLVDGIAAGVKATIELSGFDATADAVVHTIPDTPVITKISDKNKAAGTAKILLKKHSKKALGTAKASTTKARLRYTAQITTAPETATSVWTNALEGVSSRDLLLEGLVKGVEIAVRVRAEDGKLKSPWSASVTYISRTSATIHPTTSPTGTTTTTPTNTPPATG